MLKHHDFLIEIGTEELPPLSLKKLISAFAKEAGQGLQSAQIEFGEIDHYATPRRLTLLIHDVENQQPDQQIERQGPMLDNAFDDDGQPTKACLGFARSCGVDVAALSTIETKKGKRLIYQETKTGQATKDILPVIMEQAIRRLPIAKPMRWGAYDIEFIRPVHWILMLYGDEVVPGTLLGKKADKYTYGHRFHHPKAILIKKPSDYEKTLTKKGFVIPNFTTRRELIKENVIAIAKDNKAHAVIEETLLDEVTGLVEWPVALLGNFEKEFLRVPPEALIAAMRDHLKCFHVVDENDKLLPHFVTVSNIESHQPKNVILGSERVMRARLADAAFFYDVDLKQPLENHLPMLQHVTYQAKLGNLHEKSVRLATLAHFIATEINAKANDAERAGLLSKCDLVTDMVEEFPELQGIMGKYYAQHAGENGQVALALQEQYYPRFSGDQLPDSSIGCCLALAERLDTLVGIFGIHQAPTGEKDPYGLRRATLGIIRIIIQKGYDLDVVALLHKAVEGYGESLENKEVIQQVHQFVIDRLRAWYLDKNISSDVFEAVQVRQNSQLNDFDRRIQAVTEFRQLKQAQALAIANKRVSRLLIKEGKVNMTNGIDTSLFEDDAERELAKQIELKQQQVEPLFAAGKYTEALTELALLREPIDRFFDDVMVMVEEEKIRNNRLALLSKLRSLFLQVADISLLQ